MSTRPGWPTPAVLAARIYVSPDVARLRIRGLADAVPKACARAARGDWLIGQTERQEQHQ